MTSARHFLRVWAALIVVSATGRAQAIIISAPVQVGTVSSSTLDEISGIVGSHSIANTLWVHNDSGDSARFFAINTQGTLLGQFPLQSATAIDWEDIAIGPKTGGGSYLYLGDIGDNNGVRANIAVYRVDEPLVATGATIGTAQYTKALLQYPDGNKWNAESLMVDPWSGELYIITKNPSGLVYSAPAGVFDGSGTTTLTALGSLNVALATPSAADISPDGRHLLIRNRSTTAYLYERSPGQSVWDALQSVAIPVTLAAETQGEAIGWAADNSGFYTTSEQDGQGPRPLYFYAVAIPGDFDDDGIVDAKDIDVLWRIVRGAATDPGNNDSADLNGDTLVNEDDVDTMLAGLLTAGPNRRYGDADLSGGVPELDDYNGWRTGTGGWAGGEFDGSGGVSELNDYNLWRTGPTQFPGSVGLHVGAGAPLVPEPSTWLLAVLALPSLAIARRRRK